MKFCMVGIGGMGLLFTKYFKEKAKELFLYDVNLVKAKSIAEQLNLYYFESLEQAINNSDLIFLAIPIEEIKKILDLLHSMNKGRDMIVCEISSTKRGIYEKLRLLAGEGLTTLCLHPLFGPGGERLKRKKMVYIPVKDDNKEKTLVREIFQDFDIIPLSYGEHERLMAYILCLTHIINLAFIKSLPKEEIKRLFSLAGSTFFFQMILAGSVLNDDQKLLSSIHMENLYSSEVLDSLIEELKKLKVLIDKKDKENYEAIIKELRGKISDFSLTEELYKKMYLILEKLF
ncbi:MAG: prephenate dehydrogenase [Nitrososphaerales archaeon]